MFKYTSDELKVSRGNMWERGLNIFIKSVVSNKPVLGLFLREQPLLCCMSVSGWKKVLFPASLCSFMAVKNVPSPSPKPSWENQPALHPLAARGQGESWTIPFKHVSVNLKEISALSSERSGVLCLRHDRTMSGRSPSPPPPLQGDMCRATLTLCPCAS